MASKDIILKLEWEKEFCGLDVEDDRQLFR